MAFPVTASLVLWSPSILPVLTLNLSGSSAFGEFWEGKRASDRAISIECRESVCNASTFPSLRTDHV